VCACGGSGYLLNLQIEGCKLWYSVGRVLGFGEQELLVPVPVQLVETKLELGLSFGTSSRPGTGAEFGNQF
jgi:hypothetical protein